MPSEEMRKRALEWLYNADHPNECASQGEVDDLATLLDDVRSGPVWCAACEGSGRQILSVGGTRCASDHPCQQCAGLGKHLPR